MRKSKPYRKALHPWMINSGYPFVMHPCESRISVPHPQALTQMPC